MNEISLNSIDIKKAAGNNIPPPAQETAELNTSISIDVDKFTPPEKSLYLEERVEVLEKWIQEYGPIIEAMAKLTSPEITFDSD